MPLLFSSDDLDVMTQTKAVFNPEATFNPGKLLPLGKVCGELRVRAGAGGSVGERG
jgi:hypothetical protein